MAMAQRVLSDPAMRRLFNYKDLRDLFTLSDEGGGVIETQSMLPEGSIYLNGDRDRPCDASADSAGISAAGAAGAAGSGSNDLGSDNGSVSFGDGDRFAPGGGGGLAYLAGQEEYRDPDAAPPGSSSDSAFVSSDEDARALRRPRGSDGAAGGQTAVLKALFGQGQLSGALSHDAAELPAQERALVRSHASKIAQRAAASLPSQATIELRLSPRRQKRGNGLHADDNGDTAESPLSEGLAESPSSGAHAVVTPDIIRRQAPKRALSPKFGRYGTAVIWWRGAETPGVGAEQPAFTCLAPCRGFVIKGTALFSCFSSGALTNHGTGNSALEIPFKQPLFSAATLFSTVESIQGEGIGLSHSQSVPSRLKKKDSTLGLRKVSADGTTSIDNESNNFAMRNPRRLSCQGLRALPLVRRSIQRDIIAPHSSLCRATSESSTTGCSALGASPDDAESATCEVVSSAQLVFLGALPSETPVRPLHSSVILQRMSARYAGERVNLNARPGSRTVGLGVRTLAVSHPTSSVDPSTGMSYQSLLRGIGRRTR
jgi:hypothetical protein